MPKNVHKFTCSDDLTSWLENQATAQGLSLASVVRLILYRAKQSEEQNATVKV